MANAYLTDEEIPQYCDLLPVTKSQVVFASGIIDSFVGRIKGESKFQPFSATETVRPNRRGVVKLKHTPVISVDKITLQVPNSFAFTSEVEVSPDEICWDEYGYIQLPNINEMPVTPINLYGKPPVALKITYSYGYKEIPDGVKLACAMLAMNISQQGGFANIESATNLDARYSLTDPSVFTDDIRRMLVSYR